MKGPAGKLSTYSDPFLVNLEFYRKHSRSRRYCLWRLSIVVGFVRFILQSFRFYRNRIGTCGRFLTHRGLQRIVTFLWHCKQGKIIDRESLLSLSNFLHLHTHTYYIQGISRLFYNKKSHCFLYEIKNTKFYSPNKNRSSL